jgi:hypothetical protein
VENSPRFLRRTAYEEEEAGRGRSSDGSGAGTRARILTIKYFVTAPANWLNVKIMFLFVTLVMMILTSLITATNTGKLDGGRKLSRSNSLVNNISSFGLFWILGAHHPFVPSRLLGIGTPPLRKVSGVRLFPFLVADFMKARIMPFPRSSVETFFTNTSMTIFYSLVFTKAIQRLRDMAHNANFHGSPNKMPLASRASAIRKADGF